MILYCVIKKDENRPVYFGITRWTKERRWSRHCELANANSKTKLHRAIRKYGKGAFVVYEVLKAPNIEYLKSAEITFIEAYGTFWEDGGYNLTRGGDGSLGHKHPESAKKASRQFMLGKQYGLGYRHTEDAKNRIGAATKGHKYALGYRHTDDTKERIGAATRGEKHWNYGNQMPQESIEKMRQSLTGRHLSEDHKEALSRAHKGKPKSAEHNAKISAALKGKPKSEAHRQAKRDSWARRRGGKDDPKKILLTWRDADYSKKKAAGTLGLNDTTYRRYLKAAKQWAETPEGQTFLAEHNIELLSDAEAKRRALTDSWAKRRAS